MGWSAYGCGCGEGVTEETSEKEKKSMEEKKVISPETHG